MHDEPDPGTTLPPYGQDPNSRTVPGMMGQGSAPYPRAWPGPPQSARPAPPAWPQQGAWPPAPPANYTLYDPWRAYAPPPLPPSPPAAPAARLSKPEALQRVSVLKRVFLAGSVVAFTVLAWLAASHQTGVTSTQAASNNDSSTTSPFTQPSQNNGGFFNQQPGGSGFGSNSQFQSPFSRSSTS